MPSTPTSNACFTTIGVAYIENTRIRAAGSKARMRRLASMPLAPAERNVHDHDVRLELAIGAVGGLGRVGFAHHVEARLAREVGAIARAHDRMVVDEQRADGSGFHGASSQDGIGSLTGICTRTRQPLPPAAPASISPPRASARSRMLSVPMPVRTAAPAGLRDAVVDDLDAKRVAGPVRAAFERHGPRCTRVAAEWRCALVMHSCTIR